MLQFSIAAFMLYCVWSMHRSQSRKLEEIKKVVDRIEQHTHYLTTQQRMQLQRIESGISLDTHCIQYTLVAMRPYMIAIMNAAVAREDFKEAQECKNIIQEIEKLIQTKKPTL